MKPATHRASQPRASRASIPRHLLIAAAPFGARLSASVVTTAIDEGLREGGLPESDLCPLEGFEDSANVRALLDELRFDTRMREARAVIIGAPRLEEQTLAGSVTFEIATRARQSGVPAYAVTTDDALNSFDERILDLQIILRARGRQTLVNAGRELAKIV